MTLFWLTWWLIQDAIVCLAAQVLDSPFARLTELMTDLVHEQRIPIPRALMRVALTMMRRSVKKRAGFSLDSVNPLEVVPAAFIPALFGAQTLFDVLAVVRMWDVVAARRTAGGCPSQTLQGV